MPVVVFVEPVDAVKPTEEFTCNLYAGFERPIPTLPANSAIATVPSALARNNGRPEISPTLNIHPEDKLLFMPKVFLMYLQI